MLERSKLAAALAATVLASVFAIASGSENSTPSCPVVMTHTVVMGETLSAIVRSDKVSDLVPADPSEASYQAWIAEIQLLNELNSPSGIRAGQQLRIPAFGSSC